MQILLDDRFTYIDSDPEKRPVRAIIIDSCPCGKLKNFALYVTSLPSFSFNWKGVERHVWHYEVNDVLKQISTSPSILIEAGECRDHFFITNQPFEYNHLPLVGEEHRDFIKLPDQGAP